MTTALSPITPTIEQMEEYLGPDVNIPPHWSRAKQKDIIELIYYQRRVNEVMDRHKGSFWSQVLVDLYNMATESRIAEPAQEERA
jgi:hypothetical protein